MRNLIKEVKNKITAKETIIGLSILILMAAVVIYIAPMAVKGESVSEQLKLKASKDKILAHETVKDIRCDENANCQDFGEMVKYVYVSDKEATSQTLGEVLPDSALQKNGISLDKKSLKEKSRDYNVQNFDVGDGKILSVFYNGVPFVKEKSTGKWFYSGVATTTVEAFDTQNKPTIGERVMNYFTGSALATTADFYPDADTETKTVDGSVRYQGSTDWDTTHNATNGTHIDDSGTYAELGTGYTSNPYYQIKRGFFLFDTSSLDSSATVSSASLYLYPTYKVNDDNDGYDYFAVVQSSPASDTALATEDYDQCGSVHGATKGSSDIDFSNITTSQYNEWALNSTGINWISRSGEQKPSGKTAGITYLGVREGHDIDDHVFNGGGPATHDRIDFSTAEEAGTSQDPKLVVVYYTIPGYKAGDDYYASTTFKNDVDLKSSLSADTTYVVDGLLFFSAESITPDLKIAFSGPTGATMDISYGTYESLDFGVLESSGTASKEIPLHEGEKEIIRISGTVMTGGTSGDLQLQWGQQTSSSDAVIFHQGSFLKATAL